MRRRGRIAFIIVLLLAMLCVTEPVPVRAATQLSQVSNLAQEMHGMPETVLQSSKDIGVVRETASRSSKELRLAMACEESLTALQTVSPDPQVAETPQPGELGNPRSSYDRGSSGVLMGRGVIYSLFVDTPDAVWTAEEKTEALTKLKTAGRYLEASAKDYHRRLKLIVDFEDNPELCGSAEIPFSLMDGRDYEEALDEKIAEWVETIVSYEELAEKYDAEAVGMIVFVNHKGSTYAICYDGIDNPKESLVMFADEAPAVYAHELLHLFGAHDLYPEAEYTDEVCSYIRQTCPTEIMYTITDRRGRLNEEKIENEISPVTAYHVGWIARIPETEEFPQLTR